MRIFVEFLILSCLQGCVHTLTRQELEERYTDENTYSRQRGSHLRQIVFKGQRRTQLGQKVPSNLPRTNSRYLSNSNNVKNIRRNPGRNVLLSRSRTRLSPVRNMRVLQTDGNRQNVIKRGNTYIRKTSNGRVPVRYGNQGVTRMFIPFTGQAISTRGLTNQFTRGQQPQIRRVISNQNQRSRPRLRIQNVSGKTGRIGNMIGSKLFQGKGKQVVSLQSIGRNKGGMDKYMPTGEYTTIQKDISEKKHIIVKLPKNFNKKTEVMVLPNADRTDAKSDSDVKKLNTSVADPKPLGLYIARSDPKPDPSVVKANSNVTKSDQASVTSDSNIGMSIKKFTKRKGVDSNQHFSKTGKPLPDVKAAENTIGQNGGGSHHWSYRGEAGPSNWSMLYPTCSGTRQSPVDLRDRNIIYQDLPPFHFNGFHGQGGSFTLTNNGHTASIAVVGNLTVEGGGLDGMYKTAELHFHWGSSNNFGSEHSINGRKYPLEMHIVNYAVKYGNLTNAMKYRDGLAVLGTFFDVTEENPYFRSIEFGLRSAKYAGNYTRLHPVNLYGLLPRDTTRYYRYYGSLTTPPCFQSVMWTLFEDIQHLSPYQMRLLRQLYESHHDSHGDGHHQGGHGLNGHMKAQFPVEQFLMDNFRPIQPHFDRVINCNIPRYADPNFIQRSRQQGRGPQHLDFISQRISQVNADALLNKTLSKWLLSKGLPSDMLTQEQLALQSRGLFESQRNTNFDHNAIPNHHQSSGFNTGHDEGMHGGHRRPFVGQGSGHNVLNPSQQPHNPPPPPIPPNPSQLDLQVIQTQRIGPDGQQVSEIQVQVDAASGVSQEQLQVLLEDPSIMDQIQQIIQQQGGVNQTHEIIVSRPPQLNQQMGSQQQFGGQLPQHQHQHQHHHQQQQQQQQQPGGQGSTVKPPLPVKSKQSLNSKFIILFANISDSRRTDSRRTDSRNVVLTIVDHNSNPVQNDRIFTDGHSAHLSSDHNAPALFEHNAQRNDLSPPLLTASEYENIALPNSNDDLSLHGPLKSTIFPEHKSPLSAQHLDTYEFRSNVIPDFLAYSSGTFQPKRKETVATNKMSVSSRDYFGNKKKTNTNGLLIDSSIKRNKQGKERLKFEMSPESHRFRRAIMPGLQSLSPKKGFVSIESAVREHNKNVHSDHLLLVGRDKAGSDLLTLAYQNVDTAAIRGTTLSSNTLRYETTSGNVKQPASSTMTNFLDYATVKPPTGKATSLEIKAITPVSTTKPNLSKNQVNSEQTTLSYVSQTVSLPTQGEFKTTTVANSIPTYNRYMDLTTRIPVHKTTQSMDIPTKNPNYQYAPTTSANLVVSTTVTQQPSTNSFHVTQVSETSKGVQELSSSTSIRSIGLKTPSDPQETTVSGSKKFNEIQSQLSAPLNKIPLSSIQTVPTTNFPKRDHVNHQITSSQEGKLIPLYPHITTLEEMAQSKPSTADPLYSRKVQKPTFDSTGKQPISTTIKLKETASTHDILSSVDNLASPIKVSASMSDLSLPNPNIADTGMINNNKIDALMGRKLPGSAVADSLLMLHLQDQMETAFAPKSQNVTVRKLTNPLQISKVDARSTAISTSVPSFQSALDSPIVPAEVKNIPKGKQNRDSLLQKTSNHNQRVISTNGPDNQTINSNKTTNVVTNEQTTVSYGSQGVSSQTKDSFQTHSITYKPNHYTDQTTSDPTNKNSQSKSMIIENQHYQIAPSTSTLASSVSTFTSPFQVSDQLKTSNTIDADNRTSTSSYRNIETTTIKSNNILNIDQTSTDMMSTAPTRVKRFTTEAGPILSSILKKTGKTASKLQSNNTNSQTKTVHLNDPLYKTRYTQTSHDKPTSSTNRLDIQPSSTAVNLVTSTTEAKTQPPSTHSLHVTQVAGTPIAIQGLSSPRPIESIGPTTLSYSQSNSNIGLAYPPVNEIQSPLSAPLPRNKDLMLSRQPVPTTNMVEPDPVHQPITKFQKSKSIAPDSQGTSLEVIASSKPKTPSSTDPLHSQVQHPTFNSTGKQFIPSSSKLNETVSTQDKLPTVDNLASHNKVSASMSDLSLPKPNIKTNTGMINNNKVDALMGRKLPGSVVTDSLSMPGVQPPFAAPVTPKNQNVTATTINHTSPTSYQSALDSPIVPAVRDTNIVLLSDKQAPMSTGVEISSLKSQQTVSSPSQINTSGFLNRNQSSDSLLKTGSNHNQHVAINVPDPLQTSISHSRQISTQSVKYQDTPLDTVSATASGYQATSSTGKSKLGLTSGQGSPSTGSAAAVGVVHFNSTASIMQNQPITALTPEQRTASTGHATDVSTAPPSSLPVVSPIQTAVTGHYATVGSAPADNLLSVPSIPLVTEATSGQGPLAAEAVNAVPLDSPAPVQSAMAKTPTVNLAIDSINNNETVLNHPKIASDAPASYVGGNSMTKTFTDYGFPSKPSSTIQTSLNTAPFDNNGYFDFNLAVKKPDWSLHSLKKKPKEKKKQEYSEPISISDGAVPMGLLDSLSTNLLDTFESFPNSYNREGSDMANLSGFNALSQPSPEESVMSGNFAFENIDGSNSVSSQGIQNPSSSQFNSIEEAQRFVQSLNQGSSSNDGSSFTSNVDLTLPNSGPSQFTSYEAAQNYMKSIGQSSNARGINPDVQEHLGQNAAIVSASNLDPYSPQLSSSDAHRFVEDIGPLDHPKSPASTGFSSIQDAQNYIQTLEQPQFQTKQQETGPLKHPKSPASRGFSSIQAAQNYVKTLEQPQFPTREQGNSRREHPKSPAARGFSSIQAAQNYVKTLEQPQFPTREQGNSQREHPKSPASRGFSSIQDAQNYIQTLEQPRFQTKQPDIGPLEHPKSPASRGFSSIQDAQNYIKSLEQSPSSKGQTVDAFRPNQVSSELQASQDQTGFAENFQLSTQYRGNKILPEQMPLSYNIESKVGTAFTDRPQGDVLPIDHEFKKPKSSPSAIGQKITSFSNQRQIPISQTQPAQSSLRYQTYTRKPTSINGRELGSYNPGLSAKRIEPLDMSFRAQNHLSKVPEDHFSQKVPTNANVDSLDFAYRYQGNQQPSHTNGPANRLQSGPQGLQNIPAGISRSQNYRDKTTLPSNVNSVNKVKQHRQNYNNPAPPSRNRRLNQRQNWESAHAKSDVSTEPRLQRPVSSLVPGRQHKLYSRQHSPKQISQHQQRHSIQRNRGSVNKRPIAAQAANSINHVPSYQKRLQSPRPATRGRSTNVHPTGTRNHIPVQKQTMSTPKQRTRPLQITVHINQDNKIMKNEVNNHGPGHSQRQISHQRTQSRNHVTYEADGQVTRRQKLPTISRSSPIKTRSSPTVPRPYPTANRSYPNTKNVQSEFDSPAPSAGNPFPSPSAGNPFPSPSAGNPFPSPSAGNPFPSPSAGNPFPSPSAGNPFPSQNSAPRNGARRPFENRQRQAFRNYGQNPRYSKSNFNNGFGTLG